jgi:hypothetical protein
MTIEIPTGNSEKQKALDTQIAGSHYKDMAIQPLEFCQRNRIPFCESNVIKYCCRHRTKNGKEDILKAIHNLQVILQLEYNDK